MRTPWPTALVALLVFTTAPATRAADNPNTLAIGEVSAPPPSLGLDRAALRTVAEGEIPHINTTRMKRPLLISLAVVGTADDPVVCTVTATLRDRRTGAMIAVVEGRARSNADASQELRRAVARAAVRTAMGRIADAIPSR